MNTRSSRAVVLKDTPSSDDVTRSLRYHLGVLRNHRWLLTGFVTACALLALSATFLMPYQYRASTTLQIEPDRGDFRTGWRRTGTDVDQKLHYFTQLEMLTSSGLAQRVIYELDLWQHEELASNWRWFRDKASEENAVIENFRDRIHVTTLRGSTLINVQFDARDPTFAARVLNALVDRFADEHAATKDELTVRASDWMMAKIPVLESSLSEAEARLADYRRDNDLTDVDGSFSLLTELELTDATVKLEQIRTELSQTRSELEEAKRIFEDMGDPEETGARLESLEMVRNDPRIQQTWIDKSTALNTYERLASRYGPKHPRMIDAAEQLSSLDREIADQIDRIMGGAVTRVELLRKQLAFGEARVDDSTDDALAMQAKLNGLRALQRDVNTQREVVGQFHADVSEARALAGFDVASALVIDPAIPPLQPYRPQRVIVMLLVMLSAGIFSVLFVFVYERVNEKIRNTRDVEHKLGMTLLGVIPDFGSAALTMDADVPRTAAGMYTNNEIVAGSVNNVRTSLLTDSVVRISDAQVILVTSSIHGEGNSTAALSLAHSFARLDRVLLIDCHLRRPSQARLAGDVDTTYGLDTLIAGSSSLEQSIVKGVFGDKLDLLASVPDVRQATAIMASSQFGDMLSRLRKLYPWIILDGAPAQFDSSALILGRRADAIVYLVKSNSTALGTAARGIRRLRAAGGCVAGVLINKVDPARMVSRGGDYDYASYCGDVDYRDIGDWQRMLGALRFAATRIVGMCREFDANGLKLIAAQGVLKARFFGGRALQYSRGRWPTVDAKHMGAVIDKNCALLLIGLQNILDRILGFDARPLRARLHSLPRILQQIPRPVSSVGSGPLRPARRWYRPLRSLLMHRASNGTSESGNDDPERFFEGAVQLDADTGLDRPVIRSELHSRDPRLVSQEMARADEELGQLHDDTQSLSAARMIRLLELSDRESVAPRQSEELHADA